MSSRNVDVQTQVYAKYLKAVLHLKYSVQAIFTAAAGVALSSTHSLTHSLTIRKCLLNYPLHNNEVVSWSIGIYYIPLAKHKIW